MTRLISGVSDDSGAARKGDLSYKPLKFVPQIRGISLSNKRRGAYHKPIGSDGAYRNFLGQVKAERNAVRSYRAWSSLFESGSLFGGEPTHLNAKRRGVALLLVALVTLLIAGLNHWIHARLAFGSLAVFPIIIAAAFVPEWLLILLAFLAAVLYETTGPLPHDYLAIRLLLETLGWAACGLFASEILRAQRQKSASLAALVETSVTGIVTVDESGSIELANRAAIELFQPADGQLVHKPIAVFVPSLHYALRPSEAPRFRACMRCLAHKGNGEVFEASVQFTTYAVGASAKLAAIFCDGCWDEETLTVVPPNAEHGINAVHPLAAAFSHRETKVLQLLVQGFANKEIAVRIEASESTVKHTIQQLFAKTGVRSRGQLVRVALERYRNIL